MADPVLVLVAAGAALALLGRKSSPLTGDAATVDANSDGLNYTRIQDNMKPGPGEKSYITDIDGNVIGVVVTTADGRTVTARNDTQVDVHQTHGADTPEIEMPLTEANDFSKVDEQPATNAADAPVGNSRYTTTTAPIAETHKRNVVAAYRLKEVRAASRHFPVVY